MADTLTGELSEEAALALAWAPARARPATATLLAFDRRLAKILRHRREPMLAQMRLAWWRDRLSESPDLWPRGDYVLDSLRAWGSPGELARLVDGWEILLGERLDTPAIAAFAQERGHGWAALARELGEDDAAGPALSAGRLWALADLAANLSNEGEQDAVLDFARGEPAPPRLPRVLRPLAVLAGLGRRSLAQGGAPLLVGRAGALTALRIGLAGR